MVATFIIDWPVLGLLGFIFGAKAAPERWWRSRAFIAGLVSAGVFTLSAILSYFVAPDWMWMYLFSDSDALGWTVPFMVPAYLFVYVASFAAAVGLRMLSPVLVWTAVLIALAMEIAIVAITWDRYHVVGTVVEFNRGRAHELFDPSPTGAAGAIGLMGPVVVATVVVCLVIAYRGSRHAAPANR